MQKNPFQNQYSQQNQNQQQNQAQQQQPSSQPFDFGLGNTAIAGVAGNLAKQQAQEWISKQPINSDYIAQKIFSEGIRYYFDVDSNYVMKKIQIVLFPFLQKGHWSQTTTDYGEGHQGYLSPVQEIHAPDLYIPLMGLMTFILISCLSVGIGENFQPEVIQSNLTKCLFISILEIIIIKIGLFFMNIKQQSFIESTLDMASHLSYRYVYLTLILIFNLVFGNLVTMLFLVYFLACSVYFVYKTLMRYTQNTGDSEQLGKSFLICSAAQTLFSYILLKITGAY